MLRRVFLAGAGALGCAVLETGPARSEDYPSRPVRIIVPFEVGAPDTIARLVAQQLGAQLGKPFVVENRPGANGTIGANLVAKSPPDGYTLLVTSSSFAVNPSMYRNLPFDTLGDFAPVSMICSTEALIIGVNPALPVHSLADLVRYGRQHGSELMYASPGVGNGLHLAAEMINFRTGLRMVHVPYKGAGPAITALLAGEVQVMCLTPPLSLPHIRAGKIRALAYTGRRRAAFLPELPTVVEEGMPELQMDGGWYGMLAPAGTPAPILDRLQAEVAAAVALPAMRERLDALGLQPGGSTAAEYRSVLVDQVRSYAELVRAAGIQPE
ncbi:Bug family tripartite tricarboxylate transporter substrate binding protein [Roseomonas sp. BN140053]|uniref:Bug family tripartite tricarboxylate transporter substrate binding protein n=1 Tax=Roseomonas sp. BN140053 TaxID=3391898 RepID=UPI0039EAC073